VCNSCSSSRLKIVHTDLAPIDVFPVTTSLRVNQGMLYTSAALRLDIPFSIYLTKCLLGASIIICTLYICIFHSLLLPLLLEVIYQLPAMLGVSTFVWKRISVKLYSCTVSINIYLVCYYI
jgi:hypothetical protein